MLSPLADTWANRALSTPPVSIERPVTTNGAGDASTAGLVFGLTRGATPEQSVALAAASSAVVMSGARTTPRNVTSLQPSVASIFGA